MLTKASLLETLTVQATDAELGKVKDVYFDSKEWTVRYFIIDTRKWLPGKKVLISPYLIKNVDILDKKITLQASKEQVENSPNLEEHEPISRKLENEIHTYYGLEPYWAGAGVWDAGMYPTHITPNDGQYKSQADMEEELLNEEAVHLRSLQELSGMVTGYTLHTTDGQIGGVGDLILDDHSWTIQYVVIDTSGTLPGYIRYIPPEWITEIDAVKKAIYVDKDADDIARKSHDIAIKEDLKEKEEHTAMEMIRREMI